MEYGKIKDIIIGDILTHFVTACERNRKKKNREEEKN